MPGLAHISDPDLPLVRRARAGDYSAFDALVREYERSVYSVARRIVGDEQDAQEVVQDTFVSVIEHLTDFAEQSSFRTWLMRIATNHALKVLRRRRSSHSVAMQAPGDEDEGRALPHPDFIAPWRADPSEIAQRRETENLLSDAITRLDEKYRVVFVLRDVEGVSTEETASALGITLANVKVRLLRARLALRERLTRALGDANRRVIGSHGHDEGE